MDENVVPENVTRLLHELHGGRSEAANELFPVLYEELHRVAGRVFRSQNQNHTLQPTALLHEAYLKLARPSAEDEGRWQDRAHFLNLAARAMRQILVNHARDKAALKRGGGQVRQRITVGGDLAAEVGGSDLGLLALHDELEKLAELDERQARVVELRVFGGLSHGEIAEILGVALRTIELDWKMARSWLAQRLSADD